MKSTETSFKLVGKNHEAMFKTQTEMKKNQDTANNKIWASIKNLEMQIGQISRKIVAQASSNRGFLGNIIDNFKNENCKAIDLRNIVVHSN